MYQRLQKRFMNVILREKSDILRTEILQRLKALLNFLCSVMFFKVANTKLCIFPTFKMGSRKNMKFELSD